MKVKYLLIIISLASFILLAAFQVKGCMMRNEEAKSVYKPDLKYVLKGNKEQGLKEPLFAISDKKGFLYIADAGNRRVAVFDKEGKFISEIGRGDGVKLVYPYGIGILQNSILVADAGANALYEFKKDGSFVKAWLEPGANIKPGQIAITEDNDVYITDLQNRQMIVFRQDQQKDEKLRPKRVEIGSPQGIAVNGFGIWVADSANYNVKLLDFQGELIKVFDGGPHYPLTMAKGLAIDNEGRVYVADTLSKMVRVFDFQGTSLTDFGLNDDGKKSQFIFPTGISVDHAGKIYVADKGKNEVQIWQWDH